VRSEDGVDPLHGCFQGELSDSHGARDAYGPVHLRGAVKRQARHLFGGGFGAEGFQTLVAGLDQGGHKLVIRAGVLGRVGADAEPALVLEHCLYLIAVFVKAARNPKGPVAGEQTQNGRLADLVSTRDGDSKALRERHDW
jgi:hypothetical protein